MKLDNKKEIHIGKILKQYRLQKDYTQEKASEITGLAPRYISQIERGLSNGSIETLIKFCDAYDITPNHVLATLLNNPENSYQYNTLTGYNNLSKNNKIVVDNLIDILLKQQD